MKVFGIGLSETDIAAVDDVCGALDLDRAPYDPTLIQEFLAGEYGRIDDLLERFSCFSGFPWPLMFKRLDHQFPDSRFILAGPATGRAWATELIDSSQEYRDDLQAILGGTDLPARYDHHRAVVQAWFAGRPGSLLIVDLGSPDARLRVRDFVLGTTTVPSPRTEATQQRI